jgi:hypothetical protein
MPIPLLISANLLPIGTYLCVLGLLHATGRPLVTTGVRDFVALALALSGLAVTPTLDYLLNGPAGGSIIDVRWVCTGLYLVLVAALAPRRYETLIVYNCSEPTVASAMRGVWERLGVRAQDVPGGWLLSDQGLGIGIDAFPALHNVSVHLSGTRDRSLYQRVHGELAAALATTRSGRSLAGFIMASAGGLILAFPVWVLAHDPRGLGGLVRQVMGG